MHQPYFVSRRRDLHPDCPRLSRLVVTRHRRALRQELGALRLTQLMSEAEARGVAAHEIEDAEDSEDRIS